MYEVYQDNKNQWLLYYVSQGTWEVIGFFPDRKDAEFVKGVYNGSS